MYNPLPKSVKLGKSSIHGNGLFAARDIPENIILGISHVYHDLFPNGYIRTPLGGFYNHSETPNCELVDNNMDDGFITAIKLLKTIEYIKVGAELTCTYSIWNFKEGVASSTKDNWLGL